MLGLGFSNPFSSFAEHFLPSLLLFALIASGIVFLFARSRMIDVGVGTLRSISAIFTAPFHYLRKLVLQIGDFASKGESSFRDSEQYLIRVSLTLARVLTITIAIAGLSAAILNGIDASGPPKYLLNSIRATKEGIANLKVQQSNTADRVSKMDKDWQDKRQSLLDQYRADITRKADEAKQQNAQTENAAASDARLAQAIDPIRRFLEANSGVTDSLSIAQVHDRAVQFLDRLSLTDMERTQMVLYVDNWRVMQESKLQANAISEDQLRARLQPEYHMLVSERDQYAERIDAEQKGLEELRKQVSYSPVPFLVSLFGGLMYFIGMVWLMGLLIEWVALSIGIAGDISRLREVADRGTAMTKSAGQL